LQGSFAEIPVPPVPNPAASETPADGEEKPKPLIDPSRLPPVKAPSSHPPLDIIATGMLDGRSIFEHDMDSFTEKPWRRPGSNIADWFNYGFDEISWEAYCYRRRQLGEDATILRANVIVCQNSLHKQTLMKL
jgi:pre-mRNA 3'-end-processing factor FIP1